MKVNAHIETAVIPVGLMIPAPLPGLVHLGDVMRNLMALLAVARNIAVDASAVRFQLSVAFVFDVIRASGAPKS